MIMTDKPKREPEQLDEDQEQEQPAGRLVPTGFDEFGRPTDHIQAADEEAAAHWDARRWAPLS
jgi:hypothetical protein